jgi:GTP-binding nuclear protein Ran
MCIPTYKLILLGSPKIGKTKWVHTLLTGAFHDKYIPTIGVGVHPITIDIGDEYICFNVWDIGGDERYGGLVNGFLVDTDVAIIVANSISESTKYIKLVPKDVKYLVVKPEELDDKTLYNAYKIV